MSKSEFFMQREKLVILSEFNMQVVLKDKQGLQQLDVVKERQTVTVASYS